MGKTKEKKDTKRPSVMAPGKTGSGRGEPGSGREGSGREKSGASRANSDTSEAVADLEAKPWYHGFLSRDDCASLLSKKGDFVVRTSHVENETKTVISVNWERKGRDPIQHFLIIRDQVGNYYLVAGRSFATIQELVDAHLRDHLPLSGNTDAIMINPVAKADWELEHDQLTLDEKIGQGAFGEVWKGMMLYKAGKKAVAIKSCTGNGSKEERMAFMKEARIMRQYQHPNVIRIFGVAAQREPLYIVMELAPGGSLLSYLKKTWPGLAQKEMQRIILEVARGMEYLEARQCIHRDLASRNCLLGKEKTVKICDFGLSSVAKTEQVASGLRLPIKWTAPEALHECRFSSKSDVWSFGILVTEVWTGGAEPYPGKTTTDIKKGVLEGLRTTLPDSMPSSLKDLLGTCWDAEPHSRPTFAQIKSAINKL